MPKSKGVRLKSMTFIENLRQAMAAVKGGLFYRQARTRVSMYQGLLSWTRFLLYYVFFFLDIY